MRSKQADLMDVNEYSEWEELWACKNLRRYRSSGSKPELRLSLNLVLQDYSNVNGKGEPHPKLYLMQREMGTSESRIKARTDLLKAEQYFKEQIEFKKWGIEKFYVRRLP